MDDLFDPPAADPADAIALAGYAERAYLEYALSVVKGRALPDVSDGQKPVQRRILYAMARMGLAFTTAAGPKAVKSARVVGDVLGRFHPHSDQAAYDALVRMAQDFSQRYPLVDGQGNFGSRDGDGAAAMRYTEARLAPIARLLLDEIDEGTVDFIANYDGSTEEPRLLPARLPFVLLNGASGIAVGLATEIPSHNLREVAAAAIALIKDDKLADDELARLLPGPGLSRAAARSSARPRRSAPPTPAAAARSRCAPAGRSRTWRAASGRWWSPSCRRARARRRCWRRSRSSPTRRSAPARRRSAASSCSSRRPCSRCSTRCATSRARKRRCAWCSSPRRSRIPQDELLNTLLAHTSLESSAPINLTMVGADGRPTQKSLRQLLVEWIGFRLATVERRSRHRLGKVAERIHILEGRQLVLLNIDEVIALIRSAEEPKAALIERFALSERQAEDILEIRLRQLARLEAIRIEQELKDLRAEEAKLRDLLASPAALKRTVVREIEADAKAFGDERRTLIEAGKRSVAEVRIVDEPVTVAVSLKGWVRALKGHEVDPAPARLQGRRRALRHLRLPQRRHAARLRQRRPGLLDRGRRAAERPRRRPAGHLADRPRARHAAGALLRRRGDADAAARRHRRLRPAGAGRRPGVAAARRQGLPRARGRREAAAARRPSPRPRTGSPA